MEEEGGPEDLHRSCLSPPHIIYTYKQGKTTRADQHPTQASSTGYGSKTTTQVVLGVWDGCPPCFPVKRFGFRSTHSVRRKRMEL